MSDDVVDAEIVDPMGDAVEFFEAIKKWDPMVALDLVGPSIEAGALLLRMVVDARSALALAESELAGFLADLLPSNQPQEIEGVGVLTVRGGSVRTAWDHDEVKRHVAAEIADRLSIADLNVARVLEEWVKVCSFGWKVTGLRDLGLDPDEYCTKRLGPARVVFEG